MNIALDFDDTFTLNPEFWGFVLQLCKSKDVNCHIVTLRNDTPQDRMTIEVALESVIDFQVPIVFCGFKFKRQVVESLGIQIDVWIDDLPYAINNPDLLPPTHQGLLQLLKSNSNEKAVE